MQCVDLPVDCWGGKLFQRCSPLAKVLYFHAWSNPRKSITGVYTITERTISFETGIDADQFPALFAELSPEVKFDPVHSVVAVFDFFRIQFMKTNKISPNWLLAARKSIYPFREHPFGKEWIEKYQALGLPFNKVIEGDSGGLASPPGQGQGMGKGHKSESMKKEERHGRKYDGRSKALVLPG